MEYPTKEDIKTIDEFFSTRLPDCLNIHNDFCMRVACKNCILDTLENPDNYKNRAQWFGSFKLLYKIEKLGL